MTKHHVSIALSLLLLLIITLTATSCESEQKSSPDASVSKFDPYSAPIYPARERALAKDFDIILIDGNAFSLSGHKGRVVLINIWASWCGPCLDETPDLVDLYNEYQDQGLVILGVSTDEQGESVVRPFMDRFDISYPIYIDSQEIIMSRYGPTMGIPATFIIDTQGFLRYFAFGALTRKELEPKIAELILE